MTNTTATTYTNNHSGSVSVGTAGTPVIHRYLDTMQHCNYSGQARRPRTTRIWDVAPGETIEGRLCKKCFSYSDA
jgi:hypothetical protein